MANAGSIPAIAIVLPGTVFIFSFYLCGGYGWFVVAATQGSIPCHSIMNNLDIDKLIKEIENLNENIAATRDKILELVMIMSMCLDIFKYSKP